MRRLETKLKITKLGAVVVMTLGALALGGATQVLNASAGTSEATVAPDPFASYVTLSGPELPLERIEAIAVAQSKAAGEPAPAEISIGRSSLEDAMRSVDPSTSIPEPSSPGYRAMLGSQVALVVLHGHFTLYDAHVRPGDLAPVGSVLDLIIDSHTGAVIGRALPIPSEQQESLSLADTASITGVIAGRVFVAGGPPRRGGRDSGRLKVVVMNESRKVVARTTTARNGEFSVRVRPGNYFVVSKLGTFTCQGKRVLVRAGAKVRTSIVCSIK